MNADVSVEIPNKLSGFRKLQKGRKSRQKQENQDSCLIKEGQGVSHVKCKKRSKKYWSLNFKYVIDI